MSKPSKPKRIRVWVIDGCVCACAEFEVYVTRAEARDARRWHGAYCPCVVRPAWLEVEK